MWYTSSADYHINKNVLILVARVNGQKWQVMIFSADRTQSEKFQHLLKYQTIKRKAPSTRPPFEDKTGQPFFCFLR